MGASRQRALAVEESMAADGEVGCAREATGSDGMEDDAEDGEAAAARMSAPARAEKLEGDEWRGVEGEGLAEVDGTLAARAGLTACCLL